MIVAFTGHRPDKLGGYNEENHVAQWVKRELETSIKKCNTVRAISGMALGVDTWAAEICLRLNIPLTLAIPFAGQESRWPPVAQHRYQGILQQVNASPAGAVITLATGGYSPEKMQARNEWMVRWSGTLIAVWNGSDGGTANCYWYAQSLGRPIVRINPLRAKL